MSHTVKEAKNNLSGLIRLAEKGEPQVIRRHDTEVAVVISIDDWRKINGKKESLVEFLQKKLARRNNSVSRTHRRFAA